MTEPQIRLYKFLVEMERITESEYETIVGEPYAK